MKRKEIARLFNEAGRMMDSFAKCTVKDHKTGKKVGSVSEEELHAMISTLVVATRMLEGDVEITNPLDFAYRLINLHAAAKYDLDPRDMR